MANELALDYDRMHAGLEKQLIIMFLGELLGNIEQNDLI